MRTQTITTSSGETAEWLVGPVDSTGWLTGRRNAPEWMPRSQLVAAGAEQCGDVAGVPAVDAAGATGSAGVGAGVRGRRGRRNTRTVRTHRRQRPSTRSVVRDGDLADTRLVGTAASVTAPVDQQRVDQGPEGYRMGRWARLAITVTVLAAVVVVTVSLAAGSAPSRLVDVTVGPGDTLWSIASEAAPDRDPRAVIDEIQELNNVPGTVLPVGVVLRVPVSAE
jgi:LysM repeat protein